MDSHANSTAWTVFSLNAARTVEMVYVMYGDDSNVRPLPHPGVPKVANVSALFAAAGEEKEAAHVAPTFFSLLTIRNNSIGVIMLDFHADILTTRV
jgi:hypothetical protein